MELESNYQIPIFKNELQTAKKTALALINPKTQALASAKEETARQIDVIIQQTEADLIEPVDVAIVKSRYRTKWMLKDKDDLQKFEAIITEFEAAITEMVCKVLYPGDNVSLHAATVTAARASLLQALKEHTHKIKESIRELIIPQDLQFISIATQDIKEHIINSAINEAVQQYDQLPASSNLTLEACLSATVSLALSKMAERATRITAVLVQSEDSYKSHEEYKRRKEEKSRIDELKRTNKFYMLPSAKDELPDKAITVNQDTNKLVELRKILSELKGAPAFANEKCQKTLERVDGYLALFYLEQTENKAPTAVLSEADVVAPYLQQEIPNGSKLLPDWSSHQAVCEEILTEADAAFAKAPLAGLDFWYRCMVPICNACIYLINQLLLMQFEYYSETPAQEIWQENKITSSVLGLFKAATVKDIEIGYMKRDLVL